MIPKLVSLLPLCAALGGCVQSTPVVDSHFGDAVTMLKAQQIINPEAGRNPDPVIGVDGKAGKSAYDQYEKSYQVRERQSNAFTIGIGAGR